MNHELTIRFFRNSRNAKKLENYLQSFTRCFDLAENLDKPSHIYITKDSTIDDMKLFNYFWGIVRKYKETSMLADGRLLTKEQAEAILSWIRCYCNCEYFPDQKDYCFISPGLKSLHGWGCKWLCSIIRHENFSMHNGIQWYRIGPFDGTVQYIDKQDIKDKLVEESKAKCLQLCPLFSLQKVFIYVNNLPDQIDPTNDENWEYEISPENKSKRIGVRPIETTVFDLLF